MKQIRAAKNKKYDNYVLMYTNIKEAVAGKYQLVVSVLLIPKLLILDSLLDREADD